jgi:hypothetical protein
MRKDAVSLGNKGYDSKLNKGKDFKTVLPMAISEDPFLD